MTLAKRALVVLLRALAAAYGARLDINRDSSDADVKKAVRAMARKVHPDKGGSTEDTQNLLAARDAWLAAGNQAAGRGRPKKGDGQRSGVLAVREDVGKGFRIRGEAVLLTYQGFPPAAHDDWVRFRAFVCQNSGRWNVRHWCATMETNEDGGSHIHVMLQFRRVVDWTTSRFVFAGCRPNASSSDYMGEGFCRKKMQESINRGMFYVFADKVGTQRCEDGRECVAGNYGPPWGTFPYTYAVKARWPETLWRAMKLSHATWEEYLYLCRDNVLGRKRNLDAVVEHERDEAEKMLIMETTKRLRGNPALFKKFPTVPEAQSWLALFSADALRYPILVVKGPSHSGKTEWVKSLFANPLEVKIGKSEHFPDAMREFDRSKHDGLILDDVRDMKFVTDHQHALQGKYDAKVEFASTPGGTCAYTRYLYAVPTVVTCNFATENLGLLLSDDWLRHEKNRRLVDFPEILGEFQPV